MNGRADPQVSAAATDVSGHGLIDLRIGGTGMGGQERDGTHDLSRLTVPALGHVLCDPGLLHGPTDAVVALRLDSRDPVTGRARQRRRAAADRGSVEVNGAGTAQRHSAAELRAGHPERITQDPQERCLRIGVDFDGLAVDLQLDQVRTPQRPSAVRSSTVSLLPAEPARFSLRYRPDLARYAPRSESSASEISVFRKGGMYEMPLRTMVRTYSGVRSLRSESTAGTDP